MALETENYGLYLEDDDTTDFKTWREKINGPDDSNMKKIDAALADKQDKFTGNQGQVVGFDANGDAVVQAAPVGTRLRFAENGWESAGVTNLLPDTNSWVMSNGQPPSVSGGYGFEATFTSVLEAFSCFFDASLLAQVRGKTVRFGVDHLTGASSRLELVVDGAIAGGITATGSPQSVDVAIPSSAASVALRIIIFSADDMHCAFSGAYLYDMAEVNASDPSNEAYFSVRQVMQESLPSTGTKGTMYITEQGGIYFVGTNGQIIQLAVTKEQVNAAIDAAITGAMEGAY